MRLFVLIGSGALPAMAPSLARLVAGTIAACLLLPLAGSTGWSSHGTLGDVGGIGVLRASAAPALRGWRGAILGARLRGGDEDEEEGREERKESESSHGDLVGRKGGIVSERADADKKRADADASSGRSSQDPSTPEENSVRFLPDLLRSCVLNILARRLCNVLALTPHAAQTPLFPCPLSPRPYTLDSRP